MNPSLGLPARWIVNTPDMSDVPGVFPLLPGQSFLSLKSPTFSTTIATSRSGRRVAVANWSAPIWTFKVNYEVIRDRPPALSELQKLWAFFMGMQGAAGNFYYFDPYDNAVAALQFGTGDGSTTSFQLVRTVGLNTPQAITEPVFVTNGPPQVFINGNAITAFTVSQPGGVVTFNAPPAAGAVLTWTGSFMFWCHFVKDDLSTAQMVVDLWSLDGLEFESNKP